MSFYFLGVALVFVHELDAVRCKEWRIFPVISLLNDKAGAMVFISLHIPLFYLMVYEIMLADETFRIGFNYFLIFHLVLHLLYAKHKRNGFKDWISWVIISSAALSGFLDIIMI